MVNLAEQMARDALEAQKYSRKYLVLELDFSEASIGDLEDQVDSVEFAILGGKSAENVKLLSRLWGAYLGETLRKLRGGQWVQEEDGRVGLHCQGQTFYPHEQVARRLHGGAAQHLLTIFQRASGEP